MSPRNAVAQNSGIDALLANIREVFVGKPEAVQWAVATLLARGHLLIEDVPGIGKTLLGQALARSIDAHFRRVQFTNDLLPSDILGLSIYNQKESRFDFRPGPIFSNVVLTDEINRATPKTQSALLESMNDLQVTVDGQTHPLPELFMVIATQNPVEYHGTFPLPEAQLDRFLMRLQIGYPTAEEEKDILLKGDGSERVHKLKPVLKIDDVRALQRQTESVRIEEPLLAYIVAIAQASREAKGVKLGLSPRGAFALSRAAKAFALLHGRDYCVPDDIKAVAKPVMAHRIVLDNSLYGMAKVAESEAAVDSLLRLVPAP